MKKSAWPLIAGTALLNLIALAVIPAPWAKTEPNATASGRVGFVDVERIMNRADFVREIRSRIRNELREKISEHEALREEYTALLREIQNKGSVMSEDALDAKYRLSIQLKARIDEEKYAIDKFLKESEENSVAPAQERVISVIHEVAKELGYEMVIRREHLVYGSEAADLTGAVVDRLNATAGTADALPTPTPTGSGS